MLCNKSKQIERAFKEVEVIGALPFRSDNNSCGDSTSIKFGQKSFLHWGRNLSGSQVLIEDQAGNEGD